MPGCAIRYQGTSRPMAIAMRPSNVNGKRTGKNARAPVAAPQVATESLPIINPR